MNQLFIIGNGFDLAHGLETSYKSFILWYLNNVLEEVYSTNNYVDPLFKFEGVSLFADPDLYYSRTSLITPRPYPIKDPSQFLDVLRQISVKPKLDSFFQRILDSSLWVDVELIYYQTLLRCMKREDLKYGIADLHKAFDHIKLLLGQYIEEMVKPEISKKPVLPSVEVIFEGDSEIKSESTWMMLNFNYTNTIRLYDGLFPKTVEMRLINIHGDLSTQNPMIFGYGDEMEDSFPVIEKLNDNEYLKNMKTFGYFHTENYKELVRFIKEGGQFQVHVLGHSLGLSDRLLLNTVFECEACESIEIHYHHTSAQSDDYNHLVRNLSRHFNKGFKSKMRESVVPYQKCRPIDQKPT